MGEPLAALENSGVVSSAYFSPLGTYIMSASSDDHLRVWETSRVMAGHHAPMHVLKHDMHTGA